MGDTIEHVVGDTIEHVAVRRKCPHDRKKSLCKECGGSQICEHGRQKSLCKECGGSQICEHGKRKPTCKDCGGSQICEHGRLKPTCKDCGGSQICEHGRHKSMCKECGGSQICEHDKRKPMCKECGGSQICEHGRQKSRCKECGGSEICEHGRLKPTCKDCGGSQICEHGRQKSTCKDCGGSQICEHGRQKYRCKECGGSAICEHDKRKNTCKECGGSQICEHGKWKSKCKDCGGSALCKSAWCHTSGIKKYDGHCFQCTVNLHPEIPVARNFKTKETAVREFVTESFPNVTCIADKKVADGCSRRRPDILIDMGSHVIVVEIDENQHTPYDTSCENRRLMEISQDLGHRPIVFIRFNPDAYRVGDMKHPSCWRSGKDGILRVIQTPWNKRLAVLKEQIQHWIDTPPEKTIEVVQLFYDATIIV